MRSTTSTFPKTLHHVSVFFTTQHRRVLLLEFRAYTLFGLDAPMMERRAAQLTQLLDEQLLHFIGGLQRTVGIVCDFQNALHPRHHRRMLTKLLDELRFLLTEFLRTAFCLLHP